MNNLNVSGIGDAIYNSFSDELIQKYSQERKQTRSDEYDAYMMACQKLAMDAIMRQYNEKANN